MKTVSRQELTLEGFKKYGYFQNMIDPKEVKIGSAPIEFFRDLVPLRLDSGRVPMISVNRVERRELIINVGEYHDSTAEGLMPIDGDVLMFVAPATAGGEWSSDSVEVFEVPKGTFVSLNPGVWHHGCFAADSDAVNLLIALPERTYQVDCIVKELSCEEQLQII